MNCLPWMFFWLAGLPSQKCVWPSMTKISSPLAVLYMAFLLLPLRIEYCEARRWRSRITWPAPKPAMHRSLQPQTMYFIISFMSPNSMTVLSSVITMRP